MVALVMVSCVVNVLEAMTKRVLSGSHFLRASAMWVPSMLETKWTLGPTQNGFKASVTIRGPRSVLSQDGQRINEKMPLDLSVVLSKISHKVTFTEPN